MWLSLKSKTDVHVWHDGQLVLALKGEPVHLENVGAVVNVGSAGIDLKRGFFVPVVFVFYANVQAVIIRQAPPV